MKRLTESRFSFTLNAQPTENLKRKNYFTQFEKAVIYLTALRKHVHMVLDISESVIV